MGKLKNRAEACWELWQANKKNPNWEEIGKANNISSDVAETLARDWDHLIKMEPDENEPVWIG